MSIQFSGLGSGMDYTGWIDSLVSVKQSQLKPLDDKLTKLKNSNNALGIIKTQFESFKTALQTFTGVINGSTNDIYNKKTTTSSLKDCLTATTTTRSTVGSYSIHVEQLATRTITKSVGNIGESLDSSTKFSDIKGAQTGTFSFILNGAEKTVEIGAEDTLQDVADKINALGGVTASIDSNGKFSIATTASNTISLGLSNDTSNFKTAMKLTTQQTVGGEKVYTTQGAISTIDANGSLASGGAHLATSINEGTFKINGVDFTIGANTSINDLVATINSNKNVGVQAAFDTSTGTMTLTSTTTGGVGISMQDNGTNFFNAMSLGQTPDSTTLGQDAIVDINGMRVVSSSNTITNTGYDGLTINLLKMPKDNEVVTLDVTQDSTEVKTAIQKFVEAYNTVLKQIQEATKKDGYLEKDPTLQAMSTQLKQIAGSITNPSGSLNMLSQLGISTAKVGAAIGDDILTLKFVDDEKLDSALKNNLTGIKSLFSNSNGDGVADQLLKKINDTLTLNTGYFAVRSESLTKQIKLQDDRVTKGLEDLEKYRASLTKKFTAMDEAIGKLNNQLEKLKSTGLVSS